MFSIVINEERKELPIEQLRFFLISVHCGDGSETEGVIKNFAMI
jgi:hypothetical protein